MRQRWGRAARKAEFGMGWPGGWGLSFFGVSFRFKLLEYTPKCLQCPQTPRLWFETAWWPVRTRRGTRGSVLIQGGKHRWPRTGAGLGTWVPRRWFSICLGSGVYDCSCVEVVKKNYDILLGARETDLWHLCLIKGGLKLTPICCLFWLCFRQGSWTHVLLSSVFGYFQTKY